MTFDPKWQPVMALGNASVWKVLILQIGPILAKLGMLETELELPRVLKGKQQQNLSFYLLVCHIYILIIYLQTQKTNPFPPNQTLDGSNFFSSSFSRFTKKCRTMQCRHICFVHISWVMHSNRNIGNMHKNASKWVQTSIEVVLRFLRYPVIFSQARHHTIDILPSACKALRVSNWIHSGNHGK